MDDYIRIRGAREHNLQNINLDIPRNNLVVITGLSGSGKSSLAFDTIYAEGQRRYVESLSSYARQFLGQMEKPDYDSIDGLSPSIAIDQKTTSRNPRSTVGTVTEVYDYFRLLYARTGVPHCYQCGREITSQSIDQIIEQLMAYSEGTRLILMAPVVRGRKGEFGKQIEQYRKSGYARIRLDGSIYELDEDDINIDKNKKHDLEVVVDRVVVREESRSRMTDSCETALKLADGLLLVEIQVPKEDEDGNRTYDTTEVLFSQKLSCPDCGISLEELSPRMFSFNNPFGACPECSGLGSHTHVDPDLCVQKPECSINEGAITTAGWKFDDPKSWGRAFIEALAKRYEFSLDTPWNKLPKRIQDIILYGNGGEKMIIDTSHSLYPREGGYMNSWEGVIPSVERRSREASSEEIKQHYDQYMTTLPCSSCHGARLNPQALAVTVGGKNIHEVCAMPIQKCMKHLQGVTLKPREKKIAEPILKEILARLGFMCDVGLEYLTLSRAAATLSGGEAQRIRLATQIGSSLTGVLYILDEPSIGLHQRDNNRLLATLQKLKRLGNTVLVVEHDEDTMRAADCIVDMGPGAGEHGGFVIGVGTAEEIMKIPESVTGQYLSGQKFIPIPRQRRKPDGRYLTVVGACENNLKKIDVKIPIGLFTCVTGVSGSGKSSLVNGIILHQLATDLNGAHRTKGSCEKITGVGHLDKVIAIDQSPIGKSPRSNPATYTGCFDLIRELFANTPDAKARGYKNGRFSFNVKGGRCEACSGDGVNRIEMHFLPDVFVKCDVCKGKRYNRETLQVKYKGKNIADVLAMTVDEALEFFKNVPRIANKLVTLSEVGLGYIRLGQPATQLSGGEAQRVKLATELSKRSTGRTFYILDEPTTGLHIADVHKLVDILNRLAENGNTVLVIEHNLDVIKTADYIIDLGPEGGDKGGTIVACGTPEEVCSVAGSFTGQFLKPVLELTRERMALLPEQENLEQKKKIQRDAMEIAVGPKVRRKRKPLEEGEKA
ncbi:MAG: excinuclease ABC subunit UvrA [Clostridiales bacterium]|nr:excinuclease ABC subunit UvrA [Candidatus Scatonaster coprocaballi]